MGSLDALSIDNKVVAINFNGSLPAAVDGIILELVGHVGSICTCVDSHEFGVRILNHDTGNETTDAAETVDAEGIAILHRDGGLGHTTSWAEG